MGSPGQRPRNVPNDSRNSSSQKMCSAVGNPCVVFSYVCTPPTSQPPPRRSRRWPVFVPNLHRLLLPGLPAAEIVDHVFLNWNLPPLPLPPPAFGQVELNCSCCCGFCCCHVPLLLQPGRCHCCSCHYCCCRGGAIVAAAGAVAVEPLPLLLLPGWLLLNCCHCCRGGAIVAAVGAVAVEHCCCCRGGRC